jgi:arylsulfatase I/J
MAGGDPRDAAGEAAGVPAVDGLNLLPLLMGTNATSPRTEIFFTAGCLIQGDWKLLTSGGSSASWGGPTYPNKTSDQNYLSMYSAKCGMEMGGCLYNVAEDMSEHHNLASTNPDIVARMANRSAVLVSGLQV